MNIMIINILTIPSFYCFMSSKNFNQHSTESNPINSQKKSFLSNSVNLNDKIFTEDFSTTYQRIKKEDDKINFSKIKNIYPMLICKVVDMTISSSCFKTQYIKKQWNAHVKEILWIAQKYLNNNDQTNLKFINFLDKLKIGSICKEKDLDYFTIFIINSCDHILHNSNNYCYKKFIQAICFDLLGFLKSGNKLKFTSIELFDIVD